VRKTSNTEKWIGISAILGIGLIHVLLASGEFEEASYIGLMFAICGAASIIAAIGIYRGARLWGWGLGLLIAGGAFAGYVLSRTVGLPGMEVEAWLNPLGILSLVLEVVFFGLYLRAHPAQPQLAKSGSHG
jgi:hypothetical protein